MDFRLLGALEVWDGERQVPLGGGKQRAVLAFLLLHANEVVATDRMVDELWGESPPEAARKALQVYVARLRKALGGERIRTHEPGYVLEVAQGQLDVHRFEGLVRDARKLRADGEPARAATTFREALELWHGPPLADFTYDAFARAEIARLEELRLSALEDRTDADLALGHGSELVSELEALVAKHPYRERLRGQLMLALYRSGRQADALALYQETRKLLIDELGIEPSPALQRLEGAILRQEPALETVLEEPDSASLPSAVQPVPAEGRDRRRWVFAAAAVAVALAAGVVAVGLTRSSGRDFRTSVDENTVGVIDAEAVGIEAQVRFPGRPSTIASGGGFIWVASEQDGTVSRFDPATRQVQLLRVGESADGVAYGGGSVWVTNGEDRTVAQVDPGSLSLVQTFAVGNGPAGIAVGERAVWVANTIDGTVSRIDLTRGAVTGPVPVGANPAGIAVGEGAVWVAVEASGTVLRLDPRSGAPVRAITVGNGPTSVAVGLGSIWVANRQDGTVTRIDPQTNSVVDTVEVGRNPGAVVAGNGAIWVANGGDGTISRIAPRAGADVDETISVESSPNSLAFADGKVWATTLPSLAAHRGGILRVESPPIACACVDPASVEYYVQGQLVLPLVGDGLLAYRRVGGTGSGVLLGNLADGVPTPTDGGRKYSFQLRRGVRYSDGEPVRASDFRYSLERLFTLDPERAQILYGVIAGAAQCSARAPARCDLSRGIGVDDAAGRITIRLTDPDPDFLSSLTLPFAFVVPTGTPVRVVSERSIPMTGPYRVASFDPDRELRLVRNPSFRVWSQDARPNGYPDEIHFRLGDDLDSHIAAVEVGKADATVVYPVPAELVRGLLTKYPARLHSDTAPITHFMFLNTRVPPFNDARVRRALNLAADRERMVELVGGPVVARTTCQILPPTSSGYEPYCPHTLGSNAAGTWTAPDLATARRLVAESGTRGMRIEVIGRPDRPAFGRYFVSLLRQLGYRSSQRVLPGFPEYLAYVADSGNRAQIGPHNWYADAPGPGLFLPPLFTCASVGDPNFSRFCDPEIDEMMRGAEGLQVANPARADALWAEVDRAIVDRAAAIPLFNERIVTFVSERVGNHQFHPQWGLLLDQMWVK
jgi:YVTN family beta-propeller protein